MSIIVAERSLDAAGSGAPPDGLLPLLVGIAAAAIYVATHLWIRHSVVGRGWRAPSPRGPGPRAASRPRLPLYTDTD